MKWIWLASSAAASAASGAAGATAGGMGWFGIIYIVVLFGAMYFIMFRPQRKKAKEEEKMRAGLQVGDEIVTIGGIYGRIVSIKDDTVIIESGTDRSKLQIAKTAIQTNRTVHDD